MEAVEKQQSVFLPQFRIVRSHLEMFIFVIVVRDCSITNVELHIDGLYSKCLLYDQMLDCKQEKDDVQSQASPKGSSTQVLKEIFSVAAHELSF